MKKSMILLLACLSSGAFLCAQENFWNSKAAYLGQKPPGDKPEVFAEKLLMINDTFPFDRVAFSADGKEFYYPSSNTWFNSDPTKIRYFKYSNGKWNGPFVLNEHYATPAFSPDGSKLYFEGGKRDRQHFFVWQISRRPDGGWTQPSAYLTVRYPLYDFMPTRSGTCYAGSNVHDDTSRHDMDICSLTMSPGDTTIRSLGEPINTKGFDGDFFVAGDESYMIVSTKETKDFECELWISFRQPGGGWTPLVSLGPDINNGMAHRWGQYVTPDGKYLFYSTGHSPKDCRIVWVRFDRLLARLRKESGAGVR
jgi:hypothetical protein